MFYRKLGNSDVVASAIVFGCWQASWNKVKEEDVLAANVAALDSGITTFDTAEGYGEGLSERVLGKSLGSRRDEIVILTKVGARNLAHDLVIEACERSLKNLGTDRIDLYQVHWPSGAWGSPVVPISDTLAAMVKLKEVGKIRAIGLSNFNDEQMAEALTYADIATLQPPYSLFWRHGESADFPFAREHNLSILAYSSLAQGLLTGRFGPETKLAEDDFRYKNRLFQPEHFDRVQAALGKLRIVSERREVSLGILSLAWLLYQPGVFPIVGARSAEQARDNVKAVDVTLTPEDLRDIDEAGRIVTDHLDDDPVMWA